MTDSIPLVKSDTYNEEALNTTILAIKRELERLIKRVDELDKRAPALKENKPLKKPLWPEEKPPEVSEK